MTALADGRKIYKLREGRIIDGVCGGWARYLGIDTLWVRIAWVVLALAGGIGILAYLLGMLLIPRADTDEARRAVPARRISGVLVAGVLLLSLGILIVLRAVGILRYGFWGAWDVAWFVLWPLCLIAGGLFLLFVYWRESRRGYKGLRRSVTDKMVMGVCGGLGEYIRTDPNVIRFVFALVIVLSRGVGLLVYVVIGLLTPEVKQDTQPD